MSAEPPTSPGGLAARILAWLTEKFTRNFSAGKDLQRLPKISSSGLIFGHSLHQNADFLANPTADTEVEELAMPNGISRRIVPVKPPCYAVKRPATGGFL
ncbi:hypothetical protein LZK77_01020 [Rhizobium leguminosarum]|nr:hypothetical protein LZK77_01020 [Rhizobium leguminosarum]UIK11104.1 hypothetical protein LZK80_01010 [Rhizobium leguminosarum]UIL28169.1 hypothetical protein LZK75_01010 [Rhizobium leguminosarum]